MHIEDAKWTLSVAWSNIINRQDTKNGLLGTKKNVKTA
jgi:hypothetical protein